MIRNDIRLTKEHKLLCNEIVERSHSATHGKFNPSNKNNDDVVYDNSVVIYGDIIEDSSLINKGCFEISRDGLDGFVVSELIEEISIDKYEYVIENVKLYLVHGERITKEIEQESIVTPINTSSFYLFKVVIPTYITLDESTLKVEVLDGIDDIDFSSNSFKLKKDKNTVEIRVDYRTTSQISDIPTTITIILTDKNYILKSYFDLEISPSKYND